MSKPLVFISYSHKDEELKDLFVIHLKALVQQGDITLWDDEKIDTGDDWYPEIQNAMQEAMVGICLISADYLGSDFINKEEIPAFMDRRKNEGMLIIPILIRPCSWNIIRWLKGIQIFPRNNISIEEIRSKVKREKALSEITEYIYEKISEPSFKEIEPTAPEWNPPEKIDIDRLPKTGTELFGREKELTLLDDVWESADTNIITFIAWGGVGKSTLINKWLEYMQADNYKDAERVFAWSFYSQGTSDQVSSADSFISKALSWFGDSDPTKGSAWDKGQRLARLIRQKKTLLILDGMEPLQSSYEFEKGKIKDQGLAALMRSLALNNNGLCIITSREDVADITKYKERVEQVDLEKLSTNAGRALLRVGGVKGTDKELENTVEAFGNHALAVKLLPVYLRSIKSHNILDSLQIPDFDIPVEKGKHPRRVIEALSKHFMDKPEGELLKMLGFFDRPADIEAIKKIIEPPVIEDITENLYNKDGASLLQAINTLRNENLLAKESEHRPDTLDCHPLIREHFGEKLEVQNPDTWKEAHARLYEYYKNLPEKKLPDTLEEMEPLFAAVMHGCLAGKHQEALDEVYRRRMHRGPKAYNQFTLGAISSDLAAVSCFFDRKISDNQLWHHPVAGLTPKDKGYVLNEAGWDLCSLGQLAEGIQPMKKAMEVRSGAGEWIAAANSAANLSVVHLQVGELNQAFLYAQHGVELAERCVDKSGPYGPQHSYNRAFVGETLHMAGRMVEAEAVFCEAETIQEEWDPDHPLLYETMAGFLYCNFLIDQRKYQDVKKRACRTLEWNTKKERIRDIALDKLSIGKALMLQSVDNNSTNFSEAKDYLKQAVDGLREAGQQDFLPPGLFARASLSRLQIDFLKSWTDLDEAWEIAAFGQMKLHLTDYHLEAARLIQAQLAAGKTKKEFTIIEDGIENNVSKEEMNNLFKEHVAKAEELIKETGYHRRDKELNELREFGI